MIHCRVLSTLLLVGASAIAFADESWFEGRWISDPDASIESLTHGRSATCITNAPPAPNGGCTTVKDRWSEMLAGAPGREWIVDSGILEYLEDGYVRSRSVYSIRPIKEGRFELLTDEQGVQLYVIVQRTKTGFCTAYGGDYTQPQSDPRFADCYKRSSNRERIDQKTQVMKVAVMKGERYLRRWRKDGFGTVQDCVEEPERGTWLSHSLHRRRRIVGYGNHPRDIGLPGYLCRTRPNRTFRLSCCRTVRSERGSSDGDGA